MLSHPADEPIDSGLSNLMVVDQLGELLVSPVGAGSNSLSSVPLRLVPVGDGQFLLAKIAQEDLGSDTLDGDKLTQTSDHSPSHEEPVVPTFDEEDLRVIFLFFFILARQLPCQPFCNLSVAP